MSMTDAYIRDTPQELPVVADNGDPVDRVGEKAVYQRLLVEEIDAKAPPNSPCSRAWQEVKEHPVASLCAAGTVLALAATFAFRGRVSAIAAEKLGLWAESVGRGESFSLKQFSAKSAVRAAGEFGEAGAGFGRQVAIPKRIILSETGANAERVYEGADFVSVNPRSISTDSGHSFRRLSATVNGEEATVWHPVENLPLRTLPSGFGKANYHPVPPSEYKRYLAEKYGSTPHEQMAFATELVRNSTTPLTIKSRDALHSRLQEAIERLKKMVGG